MRILSPLSGAVSFMIVSSWKKIKKGDKRHRADQFFNLGQISFNPDYSRFHTNPKRKRGPQNELPSLALRVGMARCVRIDPAHE